MKNVIFVFVNVFVFCSISAQTGWRRITDPNHPIIAFDNPGFYKGTAWVDVNNDGLPDLFASPNKLFINKGAFVFEEKTDAGINPSPQQFPGGCSWADIDNDGDLDVIVAQNPSGVYLNNGDGKFTDITAELQDLQDYASWGCSMSDVNNDGLIDILFAHANGFHGTAQPQPCKFFIQSQPLKFVPIVGYAFTDQLAPYTVPYFCDFDLDGDVDLFIASGPGGSPGPDFHYRNLKMENGIDSLDRMQTEPWANQNQDGQCYNFIDYDNDGDLDLSLSNYGGGGGAPSRFFENRGFGKYEDKTFAFTSLIPQLSNAWADYDNDGDLDLITTSDNQSTRYYRNNGNKTFTYLSTGLTAPAGGSSITAGDIDNDGDLDIFIHGSKAGKALFENTTLAQGNGYFLCNLEGKVSNRSAIGARLRMKAKINNIDTWMYREISAQNTFLGQHELRAHFGLGNAQNVDSLVILWPSGMEDLYVDLSINQSMKFIEGEGMVTMVAQNQNAQTLIGISPNPATSNIDLDVKGLTGRKYVSLYDTMGKSVMNAILNDGEISLSVEDLIPGTYFLRIRNEKKEYWGKIVKQ